LDYRISGSASGSISNLFNVSNEEKKKRQKISKSNIGSGIFDPPYKTPLTNRDKSNKSDNGIAAGNINRSKYDEFKNFHKERYCKNIIV
jgi:hypothetical protein